MKFQGTNVPSLPSTSEGGGGPKVVLYECSRALWGDRRSEGDASPIKRSGGVAAARKAAQWQGLFPHVDYVDEHT
jgi:hypothetical protein